MMGRASISGPCEPRPVPGTTPPRIINDWGQQSCRDRLATYAYILPEEGATKKVTGAATGGEHLRCQRHGGCPRDPRLVWPDFAMRPYRSTLPSEARASALRRYWIWTRRRRRSANASLATSTFALGPASHALLSTTIKSAKHVRFEAPGAAA